MSPFPCSLPDLAPISPSVLLRTARGGVLVRVKSCAPPAKKYKSNAQFLKKEQENMKLMNNKRCKESFFFAFNGF